MGTRRKLSVSANSCGICGGVLKVSCALVTREEAVTSACHLSMASSD